MITTISQHPSPHTVTDIFSCDENFENLLSQQLSNMQYSTVNYSRHAIHNIPLTYLFFNYKPVASEPLHSFHLPPTLASDNQLKPFLGTSLAVQWLRLRAPNAGGPGSIPGQGTRSPMHAATKTQSSQNKTKTR